MVKIPSIIMSLFRLSAAALVLTVLVSACGTDVAAPGDGAEVAVSGRALCDIVREHDVLADSFDPFRADAEEAEAYFDDDLALLAEAIASAPSAAIKADFEVIQAMQIEIASIVKAADWVVLAVDFTAIEELNDQPEINAASDRLDILSQTECGIPRGSDEDDEDAADDEAFGTDPEMFAMMLANPAMRAVWAAEIASDTGATEDQANCYLDGLLDSDLLEVMEEEEDMSAAQMIAMLEIFEHCGIDPAMFG